MHPRERRGISVWVEPPPAVVPVRFGRGLPHRGDVPRLVDPPDLGIRRGPGRQQRALRAIEGAQVAQRLVDQGEPPRLQRVVIAVDMRRERRIPEERGAIAQRCSVAMSSRHSPGDIPLERWSTASPRSIRWTAARPLAESS